MIERKRTNIKNNEKESKQYKKCKRKKKRGRIAQKKIKQQKNKK